MHIKSSVFAITSASSIKLPAWKTLESLLLEKLPAAGDRDIRSKKTFVYSVMLRDKPTTKLKAGPPKKLR